MTVAPRVGTRAVLGRAHAPAAPIIEAAGALVWREHAGELQVRLVHRPKYDDWSWPKGKLDPGEAPQTAAAREVAEETGRPIVLGVPLPGLRYLLADGSVKRVHYWAAQRAVAGEHDAALAARAPVPPVSPAEIDRAVWLSTAAAAKRLTRRADLRPLRALEREWTAGRLRTRALLVVRHGVATLRESWHGREADRPLIPAGHAQAAALVPVLAAYGVGRIVTSPWARCAQTVAPFAGAAHLVPDDVDHLGESRHKRSPDLTRKLVQAMLAADRAAVLCTHRPVLPTVLDALRGPARGAVAARLPAADPYLEPGEILVVQVRSSAKGPRIVAAEQIAPPLY